MSPSPSDGITDISGDGVYGMLRENGVDRRWRWMRQVLSRSLWGGCVGLLIRGDIQAVIGSVAVNVGGVVLRGTRTDSQIRTVCTGQNLNRDIVRTPPASRAFFVSWAEE